MSAADNLGMPLVPFLRERFLDQSWTLVERGRRESGSSLLVVAFLISPSHPASYGPHLRAFSATSHSNCPLTVPSHPMPLDIQKQSHFEPSPNPWFNWSIRKVSSRSPPPISFPMALVSFRFRNQSTVVPVQANPCNLTPSQIPRHAAWRFNPSGFNVDPAGSLCPVRVPFVHCDSTPPACFWVTSAPGDEYDHGPGVRFLLVKTHSFFFTLFDDYGKIFFHRKEEKKRGRCSVNPPMPQSFFGNELEHHSVTDPTPLGTGPGISASAEKNCLVHVFTKCLRRHRFFRFDSSLASLIAVPVCSSTVQFPGIGGDPVPPLTVSYPSVDIIFPLLSPPAADHHLTLSYTICINVNGGAQ
ncbi:hypothetical protein DFH06DRAFT_1137580 [Mycena polygramma]|nr:hypothetical protein DFH06DRAFT_1137580 [Mycena polygramma]